MQLTVIRNDRINRLVLPEKCSGQYWLTHLETDGSTSDLVSVEGIDGKWVLKSNRDVWLVDQQVNRIRELVVEPNQFYDLLILESNEKLPVHSEPVTDDRKRFRTYVLPREGTVGIGRSPGNEIIFASQFASAKHAEIRVRGGEVVVRDLGSSNGSFLNGKRLSEAVVSPGDTLYVMGMVIVFGRGFFAINNPDGLVTCKGAAVKPMARQVVEPRHEDEIEESSPTAKFSRSPRFKRDISTREIRVDSPPPKQEGEATPIMMVLGPAITMGMASLSMGIFSVVNALNNDRGLMSAAPTLVMSLSMLVGMILWPILNRRHERRRNAEREAVRQERYLEYLVQTRKEIEDERLRQGEILTENMLSLAECVQRVRERERSLWERMNSHNDFLRLRLGIGDWPMDIDIKYAERRFSLDDDGLLEQMYQIAEQPRVLRDVPVSISLREQHVIGLIGDRVRTMELVRSMVLQLAALHSYDDLKLVFIYDPSESDYWGFSRWLPHTWSDDRSVRHLAESASDAKHLSAFLDQEFANRAGLSSDEELASVSPHYVVLALDRDLAQRAEIVGQILKEKKPRGFSLITLYDSLPNTPKECRAVIEVDEGMPRIFDREDTTGAQTTFEIDEVLNEDMRELSVALSNTELDTAASAFTLPTMLTFLEMFGVGKVEHLNALSRWRDNNPVLSLEAPVGVDADGEVFRLDLHEKYHGPHGLIAGMTGSGKSEFIMTYILSLAVNYHPDEVAFVLIDYKGGGMANAFTDLPHVAGTITNLDGSAVNRSLVSIQSELKRRQSLFNRASEQTGTSNIDIYKYQSLYREGAVTEPLPHLLIISDEFAELKMQQPEFMSQLVSAARIGRSLGVHLILATQKPSGVVDDQIWSNSRFRVCLKVQERTDSMEVIKRPDAAELSVTGRFYLQVGFNELFRIGQSAWAGAPYYPADRVEKAYDNSVQVLNNLGLPIRQARLDRRKGQFRNPPKQLDQVTEYLQLLADEEGVRARALWLPPLADNIYLDELSQRYRLQESQPFELNPAVGELDDPANQRQDVLRVPLSTGGNVVVYGSAGAGKTTFIVSLVSSLLEDHTARDLAVYILDFASETLTAFKEAPQVGDVVLSHESEKVNSLFRMLGQEIERRKRTLAEFGGDYSSYAKGSAGDMPSIVLVVHNYSAFTEMYDDKEEAIAYLSREGSKYGIHFVLTASGASAIRYRVLQNFRQIFVMQMNDATEYAGVLGNTGGVVPSPISGRGIFKSDQVYEFQIARPSSATESDIAWVRNRAAELAASGDVRARRVPILPSVVDSDYLQRDITSGNPGLVPIGIDKISLAPVIYDFTASLVTFVLSKSNDTVAFSQGLADAFGLQYGDAAVVLDAAGAFVEDPKSRYRVVSASEELVAEVGRLFDLMVERNNAVVDARALGEKAPEFTPVAVVVPWLSGLLSALDDGMKDKFKAMIEKCDSTTRASFVFCDSASAISGLAYEGWIKSKIAATQGIYVGNGLTDQYVLQPTKSSNEFYQEIGPAFGWVLARGKTRLVKLIQSGLHSSVGDDDE